MTSNEGAFENITTSLIYNFKLILLANCREIDESCFNIRFLEYESHHNGEQYFNIQEIADKQSFAILPETIMHGNFIQNHNFFKLFLEISKWYTDSIEYIEYDIEIDANKVKLLNNFTSYSFGASGHYSTNHTVMTFNKNI